DIYAVLDIDRALVGEKRVLTYSSPPSSYIGGALGISWVAEMDGKVVGFVLCRLIEPGLTSTSAAHVEQIGVHPDAQHRDVGRALINTLFQYCRERGVDQISAIADRYDRVLQRFFTRLGFQEGDIVSYALTVRD
ncbi:MAG: GNAT family N-acetyltransferase, partial [Chloroflexi bacterium]|nr:GNAT family N-acetyltransferase [Chloroflexota bacterium]